MSMSDGLPDNPESTPPTNLDSSGDVKLPDDAQDPTSAGDMNRLEEDLLIQTAQIVSQVRQQIVDVARRENALAAQLKQLDQERRSLRLDQQDFQAETEETRNSLEERRAELATESDDLRQQKADLNRRQESLAADQAELETQRATLRETVQRELEDDRAELHRLLHELDERSGVLHAEKMELNRSRIDFENEVADSREAMQRELQVARETLEEEINEAALTDQLRADIKLFEADRTRFQSTVDDWQAKNTQEENQLLRERERLSDAQTKSEHELDELRRGTWRELEDEHAEHQKQMLNDRRRMDEYLETQAVELKKKQALKASSLRFQQDHLERSRTEIEQAQEAFRVEYQKSRQRLEDLVDIQRRRSRQLDHRFNILAQFADSLYRQQESLARLQQSVEASRERERERLGSERQTMLLRAQTQDSENRRQADMVAMHAENLDKRRDRLDKLRDELEQRHREFLQTQLAVDETWVQLSQVAGDDGAEQRVGQTREKLSEYYAQLRDGLNTQRREVDDTREHLDSQKETFRSEKQEHTDWVAEQEEQLRRHEEQLGVQFAQLEKQETNYRGTQDLWLRERLEAERIIRELLAELTEKNIDQPDDNPPADLPDMPGLLGLSRFLDNAA